MTPLSHTSNHSRNESSPPVAVVEQPVVKTEPVCTASDPSSKLPAETKIQSRKPENIENRISRKDEIERQAYECRLGLRTDIDSEELLIYLLKNKVRDISWIKEHVSEALLAKTLTPELLISSDSYFYIYDVASLPFTREQYLAFAEKGIEIFAALPEKFVTDDLFLACLEKNPKELKSIKKTGLLFSDLRIQRLKDTFSAGDILDVLPKTQWTKPLILTRATEYPGFIKSIPISRSDYLDILKTLVTNNASFLHYIPVDQITEELVDLAVNGHPACGLRDIPQQFLTKERCLSAIRNGNKQYLFEPSGDQGWKTELSTIFMRHPEVVDQAMKCCLPPGIMPDKLMTKERAVAHLQYYPSHISCIPHELLKENRLWCENAVKCNRFALESVPENLKDYELCLQAVQYSGDALKYVPSSLLNEHPDLLDIAIKNHAPLDAVPKEMRTQEVCSTVMGMTPEDNDLEYVPENLRPRMPLWIQAAMAPQYLSGDWQQHILGKRDTCYLPDLPSSKLSITCDALLKPMPPNSNDGSSFFFPLKKQLLACKPFELRNKKTGQQLQQYIVDRGTSFVERLKTGDLPVLASLPEQAEVYGGRALLADNSAAGCCERYKFLRKNEPLSEFLQEEAVHRFYHSVQAGSDLRSELTSEVPRPGSISLIARENMPEKLLNAFRSELETVIIEGKPFCLCYQFTTDNKNYSTLAHQPGENADTSVAEQGLLKAAYDLGVWSSCGAVHTSTIKAFHNFRDNRKELFLVALLSEQYHFPGCLSWWKSLATDESDWGWSGLRDIGDMEFYPHIEAYTSAKNAAFKIPGYAQRCSFLEGFVSNMVAAVLHYARLHCEDNNFHYTNDKAVGDVACFIESAMNNYLAGLLGKPFRASCFFASNDVYRDWLEKTARETVYWTAPQIPGTDCISEHLRHQGQCASAVYPNCQKDTHHYFMNKELACEALGISNGEFGLTWLVRGLGLMAGSIAEQLQPELTQAGTRLGSS